MGDSPGRGSGHFLILRLSPVCNNAELHVQLVLYGDCTGRFGDSVIPKAPIESINRVSGVCGCVVEGELPLDRLVMFEFAPRVAAGALVTVRVDRDTDMVKNDVLISVDVEIGKLVAAATIGERFLTSVVVVFCAEEVSCTDGELRLRFDESEVEYNWLRSEV